MYRAIDKYGKITSIQKYSETFNERSKGKTVYEKCYSCRPEN